MSRKAVPKLSDAQWRRHMEAYLENCRKKMERTGNPLYAWEAIAWCGAADYPRYPLPEWCLEYLTTVASMLMTTAELRDTRTYPTKRSGETPAGYAERIEAWAATSHISPKLAKLSVPRILGLSDGREKNAFAEYKKQQEEIADFHLSVFDRARGVDPLKRIMKRRSVNTPRGASDSLRRGRKLLDP